MKNWRHFGCLILAAATLIACTKSPTGRNQLQLFSSSQLEQMGNESYAQLKEQEKLSTDQELIDYVQCLADELIAGLPAEYREKSWEVNVFDSDQINAFALPGGNIGVYRGLHEIAETPDQLAAVMGHEIGHVIAEHGNARMSNNMLIGLGLQVGSIVASQKTDNNTAAMIMAGLGVGAQVGVMLPFSRSHESESDQLGMDYMAQAGYNPAAAADLWRNMKVASGGSSPPELLSTHPSPDSRIDDINDYLPQVMPIYERQVAAGKGGSCKRPATD
ncbi:Peptidase family M48 [Pseudidiomarina planktonica]|uniref:Peptidase family M48 n=1 Tax=Pseudidiomarina planktonica TaxID=1323738 RepID=A0A1Y6EMJ5_9GAMM|nr:M48 family metallopeptidase [Pseudidiomarina planktonica]RUO65685.1 M48 family peptidase [Pseudidiomarina planktonica]SMQ63529.1 Peptidase family M48 [Pseudidiomarina planktonica]